MRSPLKFKFWRSPLSPQVSVRSPLKLKFWRSLLIPQVSNAIAPQVKILAIAPHSHRSQCDRPLSRNSGDRSSSLQVSVRSPLKSKFWRSPLIPTRTSAIAPQVEILAIVSYPHIGFSVIAPQVKILAIAPHPTSFSAIAPRPTSIECDRPSN